MKILVTGGAGLLGSHLIPLLKRQDHQISAPGRDKFDVRNETSRQLVDLIIHCAAYTDVDRAETDRKNCFETNVLGTFRLLLNNRNVPFVYVSTEFAAEPVNFYSYTKLWAEEVVRQMSDRYLIIRTLFKPRPYPFEKAFIDEYTQGDYVDVIAPLIAEEILKMRSNKSFVYIGTGRKTIFDLAKQTRPGVLPMSIKEMKVARPKDYK